MRIRDLLAATWRSFNQHGDTLAAAISFYMLLSVPPLLVIAVSVAGLVFDQAHARAQLARDVGRFTNEDVAQIAEHLLDAGQQHKSALAAVIAALVLMWAASRLFVQIQESLNLIWGVRPRKTASLIEDVRYFAVKRLISVAMVLSCGLLLLLSLLAQTLLSVLDRFTSYAIGSELPRAFTLLQDLSVGFAVLATLFALIYRVLPDARIAWSDVWVGAVLTTVLTAVGTWLLGQYLAKIAPAWLQGAVGSAAAFILWTYYLAQVFFLGAAFTRAWSARRGARVEPEEHAELREANGPPGA